MRMRCCSCPASAVACAVLVPEQGMRLVDYAQLQGACAYCAQMLDSEARLAAAAGAGYASCRCRQHRMALPCCQQLMSTCQPCSIQQHHHHHLSSP
jgi:hypothetical protein